MTPTTRTSRLVRLGGWTLLVVAALMATAGTRALLAHAYTVPEGHEVVVLSQATSTVALGGPVAWADAAFSRIVRVNRHSSRDESCGRRLYGNPSVLLGGSVLERSLDVTGAGTLQGFDPETVVLTATEVDRADVPPPCRLQGKAVRVVQLAIRPGDRALLVPGPRPQLWQGGRAAQLARADAMHGDRRWRALGGLLVGALTGLVGVALLRGWRIGGTRRSAPSPASG